MLSDLRFAFRVLMRAKGWTTVVVVSLALGIGASTALFSAAGGLLLRKIPVQDPDSLVRLRFAGENDMMTASSDYGRSPAVPGQDFGRPAPVDGEPVRTTVSYPMFLELRAANRTLVDMAASAPYGQLNVVADGRAQLANAFICSGNYYRLLGIEAFRGRTISPQDDVTGAAPVAVISHRYWSGRFAKDEAILGKLIRAGGVDVTIVGVLPERFTGTMRTGEEAPDISLPLSLDSIVAPDVRDRQRLQRATDWWLQIFGRLKPEVTAQQVRDNLNPVFQAAARNAFDAFLSSMPTEQRLSAHYEGRTHVPRLLVQPASHGLTDVNDEDVRTVRMLSAVVVLLLLMVCANVANLLLSRASTREREILVRLSMGASRRRLVGQLLVESLVLAAIGGALGILVGFWGLRLLPPALERAATLDWRVLLFTSAATTLTGVAFGILPALRATSVNLTAALKNQGRGVARSRSLLGKTLLVAQIAISLVLLIGAGLFFRTVENLRHIDLGFNAANLVVFDVEPGQWQVPPERFERVYQDLADRVRQIPGVTGVAFSRNGLLSGTRSTTDIFVSGRSYPRGSDTDTDRLVVVPAFFQTMEIPVLRGRRFGPADTANSPKVAMLNEAAARTLFPGSDPIGRRFGESMERSSDTEIIGVVRDAKYSSLRSSAPPTVYFPVAQAVPSRAVFEVRTAQDPLLLLPVVRERLRSAYPDLPIINITTQQARIEERFVREKLVARAYSLFGGVALLLACIGLFGLMSYDVSQRTREIGIRMALGAGRRSVVAQVMGESMMLACAGVAAGVIAALVSGRFVEQLLFGVTVRDGTSMVAAIGVLLTVSAVAAYVPARRASRIDPMAALRYE